MSKSRALQPLRRRLARQARVGRRLAAITGHAVDFHVPSPEAMANALGTPRPTWADECGVHLSFNVDLPPAGLDADLPAWAIENLRRLGETCLTAAERIERAQGNAAGRIGGAV